MGVGPRGGDACDVSVGCRGGVTRTVDSGDMVTPAVKAVDTATGLEAREQAADHEPGGDRADDGDRGMFDDEVADLAIDGLEVGDLGQGRGGGRRRSDGAHRRVRRWLTLATVFDGIVEVVGMSLGGRCGGDR